MGAKAQTVGIPVAVERKKTKRCLRKSVIIEAKTQIIKKKAFAFKVKMEIRLW